MITDERGEKHHPETLQIAAAVWFAEKPKAEQDAILAQYPRRVFTMNAVCNAFTRANHPGFKA